MKVEKRRVFITQEIAGMQGVWMEFVECVREKRYVRDEINYVLDER